MEDVLTLGDKVRVVCLGKDRMGRVSFSIKDAPKVRIGSLCRLEDEKSLRPMMEACRDTYCQPGKKERSAKIAERT